MTRLSNVQDLSVAMYISSFYPKPMGGMEIQGLRLAQQLAKQGIRVTIFTHGFKGCVRKDIHQGIQLVRLYTWLNLCFDFIQSVKHKSTTGKAVAKAVQVHASEARIPYDESNTDININGGVVDLIFYIIQFLNFAWYFGIHRKQFKIIHVHGVPWVAFVGVMIAKIYTTPVLIKESTTIGLKKFDDIFLGRFMRKCIIRNAHFVAVSKYIYNVMLQYGIPESRIHYVPNGVEMNGVAAEETNNERTVLFVGNLTQGAAKGLDVLLQSWKIVINHYQDAQLLIVGKIANYESWFRFMVSLGIENNVIFLGSKNSMGDIYKRSMLFVSPSRREGLSNALLEAMAFGLPCVVTNISGSQDMIENGINGFIVEPDNVKEMANAIVAMLASKPNRLNMRKKAYEKVRVTCSFEMVTNKYHSIYSSLLKPPTP